MKLKFHKRHYYLESGAHVVMVINNKKNKASITTAMIAATCKLLNLPVICVTIGHASKLLSCALGPKSVPKINWPSLILPPPFSGNCSIGDNPCKMSDHGEVQALVHDAREKNAVLLLDAQVGADYHAEALVQAMCLMRKETISVVWPVYSKEDVLDGPRIINRIEPEQCMVHLHDFGYSGIKKCGISSHYLMRFPIWQSDGLTKEMVQVLMRANRYSYLPPFPELPKYYDDFYDYIMPEHKSAICNVLCHLYSAAEITRKHVFSPIVREFF